MIKSKLCLDKPVLSRVEVLNKNGNIRARITLSVRPEPVEG
jgi:hypothetical protein